MPRRHRQFFTSDWHLGHNAVLKYDNRPFLSLDSMARALIKNYNSMVLPGDTCYFLGDMVWSTRKDHGANVLRKLNGSKIMIIGNHDGTRGSLLKMGFDLVLWGATIKVGKSIVTMSHCPWINTERSDESGEKYWHNHDKLKHLSVPKHDGYHLHGHCHHGKKINGRQFNVNVSMNEYRPVSLSEIESFISKNN